MADSINEDANIPRQNDFYVRRSKSDGRETDIENTVLRFGKANISTTKYSL